MNNIDYSYICTVIGNLAGIPIRIFKGEQQIFYHSVVNLPKDPMNAYRNQIFAIRSHIGYFITPSFHYYGIVNSGEYKWSLVLLSKSESTTKLLRTSLFRATYPLTKQILSL